MFLIGVKMDMELNLVNIPVDIAHENPILVEKEGVKIGIPDST
jgi:hypothetical protein